MTPREKQESGEVLTDLDRALLVELLEDRCRLDKMVKSHLQAVMDGSTGEDDSLWFPLRPRDWESKRDGFEFPERPG